MAKKKKQGMKQEQNASKKNAENCVTLEAIEAMSDSDDDEAADVPLSGWSKEAKSLRQAIADGKFNHLIEKFKERNNEDDEIEEVSLDSSGDASEEKESIGNEEDEKEEDVVHDDENEAEEEDDGSEEDDDNEEAEADNDITMEDDEDDGDDEVKPSKRQKTDSSEDESDGDDDQNEVFPETDGDKEGVIGTILQSATPIIRNRTCPLFNLLEVILSAFGLFCQLVRARFIGSKLLLTV